MIMGTLVSRSFLCVIVTVTTSSVGDGVINLEDVFTSVAVTVCVEVSMMVVTTWKEESQAGCEIFKIDLIVVDIDVP